MYRNYYYLNRLIIELNAGLKGLKLMECFSQERDQLVMSFRDGADFKYLIISVSQTNPYILLKKDFHKARKNTLNFFGSHLPSVLTEIQIAMDDRIIKFCMGSCSIYFFIRGKDTNVILLDSSGDSLTFKKAEPELQNALVREFGERNFSPFFHRPFLEGINDSANFRDAVRTSFPSVSRDILLETAARSRTGSSQEQASVLNQILEEIETGRIAVFYDSISNKMYFVPETFSSAEGHPDKKIFSAYPEALAEYLVQFYKTRRLIDLRQKAGRHLEQQLEKISVKMNQIRQKLDSESREELYRHYGNMLLANLYLLEKGMTEIELQDFYTGENVKIKLNATFEPGENSDMYFDKAKNEKQSRINLASLFSQLEKRYYQLIKIKSEFEKADKPETLKEIMEKLNIKENQGGSGQQEKEYNFKHYLIDGKYHVYVGRDSHNNDILTVKFAKQNDYWFHARGVPGSHVVLRVESSKDPVPRPVLKKAASLAAYHSKAKTSKMAPVAYTFKKYVTKKKGMEPGKVSLLREEVLLVPPEVPQGCDFLDD